MSATYLGSMTFGGAALGVSADVSTVLNAVQVLLARIAQLKASLEGVVTLTGSLEAAIKLQLLADLEVQIDANLATGLDITGSITNPDLFVAGLAQGIVDLQANLSVLVPSVALEASLTANAATGVELNAKKAAIDLLVDAVVQIAGVAQAAVAVALAAASLPQVTAAANLSLVGAFAAPAVHLARVNAPLSTVGADLQAALAGAGIGSGVNVRAVVLLVEGANAQGVAALNFAFAT